MAPVLLSGAATMLASIDPILRNARDRGLEVQDLEVRWADLHRRLVQAEQKLIESEILTANLA